MKTNYLRALAVAAIAWALAPSWGAELKVTPETQKCLDCHVKDMPALVMQWKDSRHASNEVGCAECHAAEKGEVDAYEHHGAIISTLVTPKDCEQCHSDEVKQFSRSHHAKAGEILASLDNVLAEKAAGMPTNIADAVSGCWQCHGTIVKFIQDKDGKILRDKNGKPTIDPKTWPNSGMGRLNPDGSRGSCNACHPRHSFDAKVARQPENCGKCHMGPDHPQIEIYNESKHGIAYNANKSKMALDKQGDWVLGRDYAEAPTCATCHVSPYMKPDGTFSANTHDVGERISWTLRPVVSTHLNLVVFEDGFKEDYPESTPLPKKGDKIVMTDKVVENFAWTTKKVTRTVANVVTWQQRRDAMKGACLNCHNNSFVDGFYSQFDDLVVLYNDKFARPAQALMNDLTADGVLNKDAPFEHDVQWIYWELWHHEGRRARHGASMMGPDYTHWHGMYEVAKHFYTEFLPAVVKAAGEKSPELKKKYADRIEKMMAGEEHAWLKGLKPEEAAEMRKAYQDRYGKDAK